MTVVISSQLDKEGTEEGSQASQTSLQKLPLTVLGVGVCCPPQVTDHWCRGSVDPEAIESVEDTERITMPTLMASSGFITECQCHMLY